MGKVQQRLLIGTVLLAAVSAADARKFYDDDPLWKMPKPMSIDKANNRKLVRYLRFLLYDFGKPGEKQPDNSSFPREELTRSARFPIASGIRIVIGNTV